MANHMDQMSQNQPVLKDLHLAGEPSIWPLAIGWWVLLVIGLVLCIWAYFRVKRIIKNKKQQNEITELFSVLEKKVKENPNSETIAEVNIFLRQMAVQFFPRMETASLTGKEWLQFLDKSGNTKKFTQGVGEILITAPYQYPKSTMTSSESKLICTEFLPLVKAWVKTVIKHRNEKGANHV